MIHSKVFLAACLLLGMTGWSHAQARRTLALRPIQDSLRNLGLKEAILLSPKFLERMVEIAHDGTEESRCSNLCYFNCIVFG
ncbi:MAG: hypothetical protein AAGA03_02820, partial [Planctomycetota bacterium]